MASNPEMHKPSVARRIFGAIGKFFAVLGKILGTLLLVGLLKD